MVKSRLDYVVTSSGLHGSVQSAYIEEHIDLSVADRLDHMVVAAVVSLDNLESSPITSIAKNKFAFDKSQLHNLWAVEYFQQLMWAW